MQRGRAIQLGYMFILLFSQLNGMEVGEKRKREVEEQDTKKISNRRLLEMFIWDPKFGQQRYVGKEEKIESMYKGLFFKKNRASLKYALEAGLDVNADEKGIKFPLLEAIDANEFEAVEIILNHKETNLFIERDEDNYGANYKGKCGHPLYYAIDKIWSNISINEDKKKIIQAILFHRDGQLLINRRSGRDQATALHAFAQKACYADEEGKPIIVDILELLLDHGENPYLQDKDGKSAIDEANNERKCPGLADYMVYKYEAFKKKRKEHIIDFYTRLLNTEKNDGSGCLLPFDIAKLIAEYVFNEGVKKEAEEIKAVRKRRAKRKVKHKP